MQRERDFSGRKKKHGRAPFTYRNGVSVTRTVIVGPTAGPRRVKHGTFTYGGQIGLRVSSRDFYATGRPVIRFLDFRGDWTRGHRVYVFSSSADDYNDV